MVEKEAPQTFSVTRTSVYKNVMAITTVLDYKVNEADLKKWLETNIGFAPGGNPLFSYKVHTI